MKWPVRLISAVFVLTLLASAALSDTWGPIRSAGDLISALSRAKNDDTFLFSGDIDCTGVVLSGLKLTFSSEGKRLATLHHLSLSDSSLRLERIRVSGTFDVSGNSELELQDQVSIVGSEDSCGLAFQGCGLLVIGPGCSVTGGAGAPGIRIHHTQGDFYAGIEGEIRGGGGDAGGTALLVSSLCEQGTVFLNGNLTGGRGESIGGNALCLYGLNDQAFVSVEGSLKGGDGGIAGDGIQIVSARDRSFVHINGSSSGGAGQSHGGNALTIVRISGSSSVIVTGRLSGGNVLKRDGIGGHSLLIADNASIGHTVVRDCMLEDGGYAPQLTVPRHPSITSSINRASPLTETPLPPGVRN